MEFRFDLSIDFIRGTHLIGSDFPRWRPKSQMTTRKEENAIYLAIKTTNEQMRCQFRCFRGHWNRCLLWHVARVTHFQNGRQKMIFFISDWKSEMNKWGVNSGVSWVTEIHAGHGILLRVPISKMAANIRENTHGYTVKYMLVVLRNYIYNVSIQFISLDISQSMYPIWMNMSTDIEMCKADLPCCIYRLNKPFCSHI